MSHIIYGYRKNFSCKKGAKKPYLKSTRIRLVDLFRKGNRYISKYDDDYFVSLAQFLMRKGLPVSAWISIEDDLDEFFQIALFSVQPWDAENLYMNRNKFKLYEWRKQFSVFEESHFHGLYFYRNRASMPLPDFTSLGDIKRNIFGERGKHGAKRIRLKCSFNRTWKNAKWILSKGIDVRQNKLVYKIGFGLKDDYEACKNGKAHSSWDISVHSRDGENYVDFCLRIDENYDRIVSGDRTVLESRNYKEEKDFFLDREYDLN